MIIKRIVKKLVNIQLIGAVKALFTKFIIEVGNFLPSFIFKRHFWKYTKKRFSDFLYSNIKT